MIRNPSTQINLMLTTCLISGLVGAGLMLLGWPQTESIQTFIHTPPFVVWLSLICILFTVIPVAFIYGALELKNLRISIFHRFSANVLWLFFIAIGLFFIPTAVMNQFQEIFPGQQIPTLMIRMTMVIILCSLAIFPSFLGLAVLAHNVHKLSPEMITFTSQYFYIRKSLNRFVLTIGSIIGIGTLATGGLQQTLQAYADKGFISPPFPPELTVLYGAYYSALLFVLSLPVEILLLEKGNQFIEQHVPTLPIGSSNWSDTYKLRQQVRDFLGLKASLLSQIRTNFGNLTPLIGGLLAYLFPIAS